MSIEDGPAAPSQRGGGRPFSELSIDEPEPHIEGLALKMFNARTAAGVLRVYEKYVRSLKEVPEIYDPLAKVCIGRLTALGISFNSIRSRRGMLRKLEELAGERSSD